MLIYTSSHYRATLSFGVDECKSTIHSLLALFLVSTNSRGKYLPVCLPFGAEQVTYSGYLDLFRLKQQPSAAKNDTMIVNHNSKVTDQTA